MHLVFAMQPQSIHFKADIDAYEMDEPFLIEAMAALCKDASSRGADHPFPEPVAWLLEHGAPLDALLPRQHPSRCVAGLKLLATAVPQAHIEPDPIIACATDGDSRIRRAAIETLGCLDSATSVAVTIVLKSLEDPDPWVREAAADTLGRCGASGIEAAGTALHHTSELVKGLAARALGIAGPQAACYSQTLATWLEHENKSLCMEAIQALGHMRNAVGPDIVMAIALQTRSDCDDNIRETALKALGHLGQQVAPHIEMVIGALDDPNPFVQEAAARALAAIA
jgi:hypothetical protein